MFRRQSAVSRRTFFSRAACLVALCAFSGESLRAAEPLPAQRVFTAGHSFHVFMPAILQDIATSAGIADHKQVGLQSIGGSRVEKHWELADEKNKAKEALLTGKVDVLTLSPIFLPDDGIENFATLALKHNHAVRVTVQEFWLPFDNADLWEPSKRLKTLDRNPKTIAELRAAHVEYFKTMDEHVRELNEKFGKEVVFVVPVGQAVLALREHVIAGTAPGIESQNSLFTDALGHVNSPIKVLSAYCHFAVIYHRNPVGLPLPKILKNENRDQADELNTLLQQLAWDAVTQHPHSGVKR